MEPVWAGYSVPVLAGTARNPDRTHLDRLLAHGGVKSPTMGEVLAAVHRLIDAIDERIQAGDLPPQREQG